jgi:hypothetical protein
MKIYHQAGHNTVWAVDSHSKEGCGDGIIFSPVHITKAKMEGQSKDLKSVSLFDPQFYIPDSQKSRLHTYDFFPEKITNGFSTTDFETVAHQSAGQCLQFQIENDFESLIVPARYYSEMVSDYIERQKAFSVEPFLAEITKIKPNKKIFLTLPVTAAMTMDKSYRQQLLNWITSYPEIYGVYLLNEFAETSKQILDYEKILANIEFIEDLQGANLKVIVGYCNTEAIIFTLLNPYAVTVGAYENTRGFSIDKFLQEESERRGPAPRLYFSKLLNWMRFSTANEIRQDHPKLWEKIYTPTEYSESLFGGGGIPHFSKPELYKHHFVSICEQLKELASQEVKTRLATVQASVLEAKGLYDEIEKSGVMYFDDNCSGKHLPMWNRVIKRFERL